MSITMSKDSTKKGPITFKKLPDKDLIATHIKNQKTKNHPKKHPKLKKQKTKIINSTKKGKIKGTPNQKTTKKPHRNPLKNL